ncbi:hypothetical protein [Aurantivibrio infirmus]
MAVPTKSAVLISLVLGVFCLANCSADSKSKPKSLVESQKKLLDDSKSVEAQLKEAEEIRRKKMDGQ